MTSPEHLNALQFRFVPHGQELPANIVKASYPDDPDRQVGRITMNAFSGEVGHVHVKHGERRAGIATAMWHYANRLHSRGKIPEPMHSENVNTEGRAWAKSVGGKGAP